MFAAVRTIARLCAASTLALGGLLIGVPPALTQPCSDIGVVFARGTAEPPGAGRVGQSFIDSLRARAAPRTVAAYAVSYPASGDFGGGTAFTRTVVDGVRDETDRLREVVSVCPDTRLVLGGYSQGAVVTALTTSGVLPAGLPREAAPPPIPSDAVDNVAAVVLFGKPAGWSAVKYASRSIGVGPAYRTRVLELCAPGDTVCSGAPPSGSSAPHRQYAVNGMVERAAVFAVDKLTGPRPA